MEKYSYNFRVLTRRAGLFSKLENKNLNLISCFKVIQIKVGKTGDMHESNNGKEREMRE